MRGRNRRKEDPEELSEGYTDRGNRPRLNHQEQRPAVKESPQRPQRFTQINILTAGAWHHGRQFAVAKRCNDGHEPRYRPRADQQRRRVDLARNLRRNNKDTRADHRPHDQHGGAGQSKLFDQFLILMTVSFPIAGCAGLHRRCTQGPSCSSAGVPAGCREGVSPSLNDANPKVKRLYLKTRKNSSADLRGSRNRSDITATESAPASMTDAAFPRVIPPIATSGLRVNWRAQRTPSSPTTGSGLSLLAVSNTAPIAR